MTTEPSSVVEPGQLSTKKYLYGIDLDGHDAPALLLRAVGENQKVLEIGCASGVQSRAMSERGCRVTGIEIDADAARQAREFCDRVIVADLETLNFNSALGKERFDVITIADVLEHLKRPDRVLSTVRRFLLPEGRIIASIPNVVHAGLILEMAKGSFDYRTFGLLDDTHIRFFTLKSITNLFDRCGLKITQIERALRPIEASEFAVKRPLTSDELDVIKFIRTNNPEHETYQFVVSACAREAVTPPERNRLAALRHRYWSLRAWLHERT